MGEYALLRALYLDQGSNADLMSAEDRSALHVATRLDDLVPTFLARGLDVVLTGNPGDGKSHLVRRLVELDRHKGAEVVLDLSATRTSEVVAAWASAREKARPFLLCANEGPLRVLLADLCGHPSLGQRARELLAQVGHLLVSDSLDLPPEPAGAVLVDLADRELLDGDLVARAIGHVCNEQFLPECEEPWETPAGRSITLLKQTEPRRRLARILATAGRRMTEHVTFRRLWGALSYAICLGMTSSQQEAHQRLHDGLGHSPLDNLLSPAGQGALLEACRASTDPASYPTPALDEALWHAGAPAGGEWFQEPVRIQAPAHLWRSNQQKLALRRFKEIKRFVTLAHSAGAEIVARIEEGASDLPSAVASGDALRDEILLGVRRSYLSLNEEAAAPAWLLGGLPAWVGVSYQDLPASHRPHVVTTVFAQGEFEIARPVRAPWLGDALGRPPEVAWLRHRTSGISLRLDVPLLSALRRATQTCGHLDPPEPVQRFLVRLAGWTEQVAMEAERQRFAVLEHPRGELVVTAGVEGPPGGASYVAG